MSFTQTYQKITESQTFKNFREKHPNAELCAGFFIIDFLSNDIKKNLDYKVEDKIFTFDLNKNNEVIIKEDKILDSTKPLNPIKPEVKTELQDLKGLVGIKALDNGISAKINKIIAVLQTHQEKQVWNLTCMLEGLIILHILIDSETGNILKFERKSMMDLVKKK